MREVKYKGYDENGKDNDEKDGEVITRRKTIIGAKEGICNNNNQLDGMIARRTKKK